MTPRAQQTGLHHKSLDVFRTKRLVVRKWRPTDEPNVLALYSIPDVVRWVDDGQALTPSEAARWMEVTAANYENRGYGMFAIEDKKTAQALGFGGLVHPGNQVEAEVKYAFFPEFWRRGLATEFVRGLARWAKVAPGVTQMIATVAPENVASQSVLLKSGFRQVAARLESDGSRTEVFVWDWKANESGTP